MQTYTKMRSRKFPDVIMKVIPGHFVTPNSHINYYIDMTTMKTRQSEAKAAARAMASTYAATTIVDTIVCMDGMEVIGAYLADELTQAGIMSMNAHKTIYVYSPEFDNRGQMIFRENSEMMIKGKHVLLLLASATTGQTILRAGESIDYYGGTVAHEDLRAAGPFPVQDPGSSGLPQLQRHGVQDVQGTCSDRRDLQQLRIFQT